METIKKPRLYEKKQCQEEKNISSLKIIKKVLKEHEKIIPKVKDKDLTIFLGDTGAGKSTAINFLSGSILIKTENELSFHEVIDLKEKEKVYSEIGHSSMNSKTKKMKLVKNGNKYFLDTQGFSDSRGVEYDIALFLLLEKIFQNCRSLKLIFVSDFAAMKNCRGNSRKYFFDFIEKLFVTQKSFENNKNSIMILITKQKNIQVEKIKKILFENKKENSLRYRTFFYDPLNIKNKGILDRNEFIKELNKMKFLEDKILEIPFNMEQEFFFGKIFEILKIK